MDRYLCHYGVKGMKWGVRRYQNPDGSYTPLGRQRYGISGSDRKAIDEHISRRVAASNSSRQKLVERQKTRAGIDVGEKYDTIKKASEIQRVTDKDETLDSNRKYVSITDSDKELYITEIAYFAKDLKNARIDTYEFKKDVRVAKGEEVAKYILDKYGNESARDFSENASYLKYFTNNNFTYMENRDMEKNPDTAIAQINRRANDGWKAYHDVIKGSLFQNTEISSDVFKEFKKRGYDAIVDVEDTLWEADYPLIVLDPKKTMKRKSSQSLWDYYGF